MLVNCPSVVSLSNIPSDWLDRKLNGQCKAKLQRFRGILNGLRCARLVSNNLIFDHLSEHETFHFDCHVHAILLREHELEKLKFAYPFGIHINRFPLYLYDILPTYVYMFFV